MEDQNIEFEIHKNKRPGKVYLSPRIEAREFEKIEDEIKPVQRPIRILSTVFDPPESHEFFRDGNEISLKISPGQRVEVIATFYEDSRKVKTLNIQSFNGETGNPHRTHFSFQGEEIEKLLNLIKNVLFLPIATKEKEHFDSRFLEKMEVSRERLEALLDEQPDLLHEIIRNKVTKQEIVNLGYRKAQLKIFEQLLNDRVFFSGKKKELGPKKGDEDVWQDFFERNPWIFGYGISYIFNSPLKDKKLEQVVSGFDFNSRGKRVDVLLKSSGIVQSFCLGELKTPETPLLKVEKNSYRGESWRISPELAGAIAQSQKAVQKSIENLHTKNEIKELDGTLTGEKVFLYKPKSFIVAGRLSEFEGEHDINEDKFSSFELFRRSMIDPEIITYDELYERAKFIVKSGE